jgi:hypothetical protein
MIVIGVYLTAALCVFAAVLHVFAVAAVGATTASDTWHYRVI